MNGKMNNRTTLRPDEPHPAAHLAQKFIAKHTPQELAFWRESFASCAIEGNRLAEICNETLRRLMESEPVSDRYLLGLAWAMRGNDTAKSPNYPNG